MKRVSKQVKQKTSLNPKRYFSIEIKKKTVKDIESGKCTVREASRELLVSENSIYIWLNKFSRYLKSNKRLIVEEKSESYRSKELEMKIKDLEAALGRKQLEVDYLNKLIDVAEQKLNLDIKKNSAKKCSNGSGTTKGGSTPTK